MAKRYDSKHRLLRTGESERADGYYTYRWTSRSGKRNSVTAGTLEELREKENEIQRDVSDGIRADAKNVTLNNLYELWRGLKRNLKENTFSNYCYMYEQFVADNIGMLPVTKLKRSDIKAFYNMLADTRGLKIATIDNIHTVLHQILQLAVEDNYIRRNISDNLLKELKNSHHYEDAHKRALTIPEQELFLEFLADESSQYYHWFPIFTVMVGTGMRVGDDDDKIRLNQRKPSKYKGLRRFGPEKNLQRINKFMKERPIFYKNLIQMKENIRFYLRCFYCITKVMILQFNSENRTELARNG